MTEVRLCRTCATRPSGRYYHCKPCRSQRERVACPEGCGNTKGRRAKRCAPCNRSLRGPDHPSWKGGVIRTADGYVREYAPDHPKANMGRYVSQHVLVMEQALGRHLLPGESVHHKNGVRHDNRIRNLELWVTGQPTGQRVSDALAWARELIERYGDMTL